MPGHHITKDAVREAVSRVADILQRQHSVRFILLFGSVVTGNDGPLSDIDLGIYVNPSAPRGLDEELAIGSILAKALGSDDVDVVILNDANPGLKFDAMRSGVVLFCVDEGEYEDFCVRSAAQFYDWSEFLDRQYEAATKYLARSLKSAKDTI